MQIVLNGNELEGRLAAGSPLRAELSAGGGLEIGGIVSAEVIFASDSNVNIRLENGAVVRAALEGGVTLSEGDKALFFVSENDGRRIVLIPVDILSEENMPPPVPGTAAQSPAPGAWPTEIADAIGRGGYTPTAELAAKAAAVMAEFPESGADTAVFIAANGIKAEPESVALLNMFKGASFNAGRELGRIFKAISGSPVQYIMTAGVPGKPADPANAGIQDYTAAHAFSVGKGGREPETGEARRAIISPESKDAADGVKAGHNSDASRPGRAWDERTQKADAEREQSVRQSRGDGKIPGDADNSKRQALKSLAGELFGWHGGGSGGEKPGGTVRGEALRGAVTGLPEALKVLRVISDEPGAPEGGNAARLIERAGAAVNLMEKIRGFAFVQIPLLRGGEESAAELYVLRRRSGRTGAAGGELCVVLALDLKNMGHVEALLRIRGRSMTIKITAQGEKQAQFLSSRMGSLRSLMYSFGYELVFSGAEVSKEKITPLNANAVFSREKLGNGVKIDIKI